MTVAVLRALDFSASITASDLERSLRFYADGLGFIVDQRMEEEGRLTGVMMKAGLVTIGLSQDDFAKGKARVKGAGVGFHIVTEQELSALAKRVQAAGFPLENELAPMAWGPMGFTTRDPDGFRVTVTNPE